MDSDAALAELRDRLSIALMPLKNWHGQPQPAPVLWRDADSKWADAVLSEGEVAVLSGPGGIGKSYLALSWARAATRKETGSYGENCGLRVRRGPDRGSKRMPGPGQPISPGTARTAVWTTDKGESNQGAHWSGLWKAIDRIGARLVVIDPASAALEGATNDSGPVRRFMPALRLEAETSGVGVLVVAHDTKSDRNEAKAGGGTQGRARWPGARLGSMRRGVFCTYGAIHWGGKMVTGECQGKLWTHRMGRSAHRGQDKRRQVLRFRAVGENPGRWRSQRPERKLGSIQCQTQIMWFTHKNCALNTEA